ncbi:putative alpha/beta hydrolase [Xylariomycetidae sp. FL2044]|nr:putative alpha/beta hydrolase [Xylariomycetidae sp. FL2044]
MAAKQTVQVPHLNARVGYALSNGGKLDPAKPTCVMINSMNTCAALYADQLDPESDLAPLCNVLAIEPLGHGATTCEAEHWTYWDSARVALQAMTALGVDKAFVLGTSQGGWIAVRMALLEPERVLGLILLGTSMDSESEDSRTKGCWNPFPLVQAHLEKWKNPDPQFVVGEEWMQALMTAGFGPALMTPSMTETWTKIFRSIYSGEEGRHKLRMSAICLAERDGLLLRLEDVRCPVLWLHGTADAVYGTQVPKEHIKLFTDAKDAKLTFVENGSHFLSASHPKEVEHAVVEMINQYR